jgi:hypothetical protein
MSEKKVKALQGTIAKLNKRIDILTKANEKDTITPDLNKDGKVTPSEAVLFNIFQEIIRKTQRHSIQTLLIIVIFLLASALVEYMLGVVVF